MRREEVIAAAREEAKRNVANPARRFAVSTDYEYSPAQGYVQSSLTQWLTIPLLAAHQHAEEVTDPLVVQGIHQAFPDAEKEGHAQHGCD